jgi:hypothetical protein
MALIFLFNQSYKIQIPDYVPFCTTLSPPQKSFGEFWEVFTFPHPAHINIKTNNLEA